jgi:multidrug efflux pump subunit AcrA (membrane-fusion protein)
LDSIAGVIIQVHTMNNVVASYREKIKQSGSFLAILSASLLLVILVLFIGFGVKVHHLKTQLADFERQLAESKSQATQAQTELGTAKAAVTDLQNQLTKTKSQQTYVQAQLDESKNTLTELRAQLDQGKVAATQLQTQLDKDKIHSTELQTQLDEVNSGSMQLLTQLNQAKIQSMDLQTRLQKAESDIAELQPLLLKTGHMPVTTSFERIRGGDNFTLHINNLYQQPVSVDVSVTGTKRTRSQHDIIGSGATQNVDKLAAGENVVITSAGYEPVRLTVQ